MPSQTLWQSMSKAEKMERIRLRRKEDKSWSEIAEELLGDSKKKSTVYQFAQRNADISKFNKKRFLERSKFRDADMWVMFDIIENLYPRLDATIDNLIEEMKTIKDNQSHKFETTGAVLDKIEEKLITQINSAIARSAVSTTANTPQNVPSTEALAKMEEKLAGMINSAMSRMSVVQAAPTYAAPVYAATTSSGPPPPPSSGGTPPPPPSGARPGGAPPPPPAGFGAPPPTKSGPSGSTMAPPPGAPPVNRTDFEDMSMEDIKKLSPEFLQTLSTADRSRLQERVKELKMIEKMPPAEREEYLAKKKAEKERKSATEGVGDMLKSMLDDQNSLFAKMRRAAQQSEISGSGTFGQFAAEYVYTYCFSCGKSIRTEDKPPTTCPHCNGSEELLVPEETKTEFKFFECLTCKQKEEVSPTFSRGSPIVVRNRWKIPKKDAILTTHAVCASQKIREITAAVHTKEDPDKQYSYYLTLLRSYQHHNLPPEILQQLFVFQDLLQLIPDLKRKNEAVGAIEGIMNTINALANAIKSKIPGELKPDFENYLSEISELQKEESPQCYKKMNEVAQFIAKIDQLVNRFIIIFEKVKAS